MIQRILHKIQLNWVRKQCSRWSSGEGTFYPTSTIQNFAKRPELIRLGKNTHIRGELLVFGYGGRIEIGDNTFLGEGSRIWSGEEIKIGHHVLISHNVNIVDTNSHEINHLERAQGFVDITTKGAHPTEKGSILTKAIVIEDYAWISFNAIILKGVTIGKGAIVAAGSVVTKDVAPFTLVAGNPATFVRKVEAE